MKHLLVLLAVANVCLAQNSSFSMGQAARLVVGQSTFTNSLQGAEDKLIGAAAGVAYANNMLFVVDSNIFTADPNNNRVLIFPTTDFPQPTDVVNGSPLGYNCFVCVGKATNELGQPDFNDNHPRLAQAGFNTPLGVSTDGFKLAIADTDNNRVLIWNTIPTRLNQPPDVVVGQADFTHNIPAVPPTAKSMRGPHGVWLQGGKMYVADTQNNRVLVYNQIPTSNGAAADLVLGAPNFTTAVPTALTVVNATASNMTSPVSVTTDGLHLFVTDLGANRVLIWNHLPTSNGAAADVEVGQPDMTSALENNVVNECVSTGKDTTGNALYPQLCERTLSFPRFAISDGTKLFIADGGNDRILIYSTIPTTNSVAADLVLGAPDFTTDSPGDNADAMFTPTALALDGTNLYVADSFNRRILVFTPGTGSLAPASIRNGASLEVFAIGGLTIGGTITENDTITVTITTTDAGGTATNTDYKYTIKKTDTLTDVVNGLVTLINKPGDPNVTARPNNVTEGIVLTAKKGGNVGTAVGYSFTLSTNATITAATTTGANLSLNLQDASKIAPGSLIAIFGSNLSEDTAVATPDDGGFYPDTLANVQVYSDGIRLPLISVSPGQINAQLHYALFDRTSASTYVRTVHKDGSVTVTTPSAVSVVDANPGIFAEAGTDPRPGFVYHAFSNSAGAVSVDGTIAANDVASVTIGGTTYTYTVVAADTLNTVRDALVKMINADPNSPVTAFGSNVFTRILLIAKDGVPNANAITVAASVTTGTSLILTALNTQLCCNSAATDVITLGGTIAAGDIGSITIGSETFTHTVLASESLNDVQNAFVASINADANSPVSAVGNAAGTAISLFAKPGVVDANSVIVKAAVTNGTSLTLSAANSQLCCAVEAQADTRVTPDSPATPGELVYIYSTGLGLTPAPGVPTGQVIPPGNNDAPIIPVDSILAGGSTANIIFTNYVPGQIGTFKIVFQLNSSLATDPQTQLTIAQQSFVSNVVTFPVAQPAVPPAPASVAPQSRHSDLRHVR